MEILLAIVVASAVIFFGALISMGNERQRKAIDNLNENITLWAIQDLHIKHAILTKDVKVDNPQRWLSQITSNVLGHDLNLQITETFDKPQSILCVSSNGDYEFLFTSLSPSEIQNARRSKHSKLDKFRGNNPTFSIPKNSQSHELSTLNNGILFDLELKLAWAQLTGCDLGPRNRIWMYKFPHVRKMVK